MLKKIRRKLKDYLTNDIGIDLGTSNTLVYLKGQGIVINEPSVVAVNQKTGQVVAFGKQAKEMVGRTPGHVVAIKPLVDGVISDFEITEEMLAYLLNRAQKDAKKLLGPRVVIGVPSGITDVETRAVRDAAKNAGAREVFIVEEPMAAAIGIRLPVREPLGSMIVDIGGGTTDIAVISLGGVVQSRNVRVAGVKLNNDIVAFIRSEFKILIGEETAEKLKIAVGSVLPDSSGTPIEMTIRGRDLVTGLPREVVITDADVREAVARSIDILIDAIKEVIETTPPEVLSDVMVRGVFLVGGGALIKKLPEVFKEELKIPVFVSDDPLTAVVRGTGIILENLSAFSDIFIVDDDEVSSAK